MRTSSPQNPDPGKTKRWKLYSAASFGLCAGICATTLALGVALLNRATALSNDDTLMITSIAIQAFLAGTVSYLLLAGHRKVWRAALAGLLTPPLAVVTFCVLFLFPDGVVLIPAGWIFVGIPLAPVGAVCAVIYALVSVRLQNRSGATA